uniref:Uncharacterized protein n=1 Tax=Salvator merianae TaxID=96440 RepID=A0A8D0BUG5_SALMN
MGSAPPSLIVGTLLLWAGLALVSGNHRPEICFLPADRGPCKAYKSHFFYNPDSNQCEKFIYGGCQGNENNFETLQKCRDTCVEKPGICPRPNRDLVTVCQEKCAHDWSCPGPQKCCSFGCLVKCADPV